MRRRGADAAAHYQHSEPSGIISTHSPQGRSKCTRGKNGEPLTLALKTPPNFVIKYSIHDTDSNTSYTDLNLFDCHWTYPHDAQQLRRGAPRRRAPTPMPARLVPFWRPKRGGEKMEKRSRGAGPRKGGRHLVHCRLLHTGRKQYRWALPQACRLAEHRRLYVSSADSLGVVIVSCLSAVLDILLPTPLPTPLPRPLCGLLPHLLPPLAVSHALLAQAEWISL